MITGDVGKSSRYRERIMGENDCEERGQVRRWHYGAMSREEDADEESEAERRREGWKQYGMRSERSRRGEVEQKAIFGLKTKFLRAIQNW